MYKRQADDLSESTLNVPAHQCERNYTGTRGQPKFKVSKRQIQFLRELHFPWVRIAELLGISSKTLTRRRQEFQIEDEEEVNWSSLRNGELREIRTKRSHGNDCYPWDWSKQNDRCVT